MRQRPWTQDSPQLQPASLEHEAEQYPVSQLAPIGQLALLVHLTGALEHPLCGLPMVPVGQVH